MDAVDVLNGVIKTLTEENDRLKKQNQSLDSKRLRSGEKNKKLTAKLTTTTAALYNIRDYIELALRVIDKKALTELGEENES